jgi:ribonucleotide reductase alpha subunit
MEPSSVPEGATDETTLAPLVERYFTREGEDVWSTVEWERRDARAGDFFQANVEVPTSWSDDSIGVVAKLYFATVDGVREDSVRQMITRVVSKISYEGLVAKYFGDGAQIDDRDVVRFDNSEDGRQTAKSYSIFYDELVYICLHQIAGFNTPTWLNIGVPGRRQCGHACYPLSIQDHMLGEDGIIDWWRKEAIIFKTGGGTGINLSNLRGSMEKLSTGGKASGPLPYMRAANAGAETLKSGGVHRRAAKFVCLDDNHPDIEEFIWCKVREDERMVDLMKIGHDLSIFTAEGERNVAEVTSFQSANNSVCLSDDFMRAVENDGEWDLIARVDGRIVKSVSAEDLLRKVAEAAWRCADPGVIFIDTINSWHTTPSLGPVTTSNTCLTGKTLVDTSEGRIRIDHLQEMYATGQALPYAFGYNQEDAMPVMKRIQRAMMTKMTTELVRVHTDKGVVIECTPDHKILCREHGRSSDGFYVPAGELKPGQSLRKIGRYINTNRSNRRLITHRVTESSPNGCSWQSVFMWEHAFGPIPEGMEVHHINEDPTDDRLSNLELIDSGTHQSFHSTGTRNGNSVETDTATLVEVYDYASGCRLRKSKFDHVTYNMWKRAVDELELVGKVARGNHKGIRGMNWQEFGEWITEQRALVNDKVSWIEWIELDEPVPVYDITVEGVHNFGVALEGVEHTIVVANCGEIVQNNDTACNLAALNLLKFLDEDFFKISDFRHVVDVMMTAMDIVDGFSELPTDRIQHNTRDLRQCGLGFTNLGAAVMAQALPYDSDEGRNFAAACTALLTGRAYHHSSRMAEQLGTFKHFDDNRDVMLDVIDLHLSHLPEDVTDLSIIWREAIEDWHSTAARGQIYGFRNSQATAMMPTGTVSFLLGADTTGIEPAFSLVTHKSLAAGGTMVMINQSAQRCAAALGGYSEGNIKSMAEGDFSCISPEDLPSFATAVGENSIEPMGHLRMVAAIQPFVSQAISKTTNLPNDATVDDIFDLYMEAWRRSVKVISVYRDGSKATQILSSKPKVEKEEQLDPVPVRRRLPRTRSSITHKIHLRGQLGDHEGYVTLGKYPDGAVGEMFLEGFGRLGGFTQNALSAWATSVSVGLQYGVPLEVLVRKFVGHSDETGGIVVPEKDGPPLVIRSCDSIIDYIARWIISQFGSVDICEELGVMTDAVKARKMDVEWMKTAPGEYAAEVEFSDVGRFEITPSMLNMLNSNGHAKSVEMSANSCRECKIPMQRTGACWTCSQCGANTGCG